MDYLPIFNQIKELKPRVRGLQFEKLLNKICEDQGILISDSYKTADNEQQIDGAIEVNSRIFLIEAKWEKKETLAASKLFSFLGKINSKIEGTLGVFISYNTLSDNVISAARNGLRQSCIIIHGKENIMDIVSQKVRLDEFIWFVFQQASLKNESSIDTKEFQVLPSSRKSKNVSRVNDGWDEISTHFLDKTSEENFHSVVEKFYSINQNYCEKTLNLFPFVHVGSLRIKKYDILVKKCLKSERENFKLEVLKFLKSKNWDEIARFSFLDSLKDEFEKISEEDKDVIISNIIATLEKNDGDYNKENYASEVVNFIYKELNQDELIKLANAYLMIYVDFHRKEKFLQKIIANKIFNESSIKNSDPFSILKDKIVERLRVEKNDEYLFENVSDEENSQTYKDNSIKRVLRKFSKILSSTDHYDDLAKEYDKL